MKTNEKKCKLNKSEFPDCHCDECYHNVEEYLGKVKGKVYLYTGDRIQYMQNKKVTIESFLPGGDEHKTCEAFIKLFGGTGGQCDWIPKKEIINNLTTKK